ncbi:Auxin-binding protein [Sinorhizobium meliloti]|uniref:FixH family protein n=1 Tax=Rhizobium meliloti TaxID=382 RepID=UPI000FDC0B52|nr:FixH family protein [Sinorhizobium meliloti]MDE3795846.1 FixH family protein [Sinorhizobium meliloti]RVK45753.1 Auxin-binding protein [Sinorhizobium meliloti]
MFRLPSRRALLLAAPVVFVATAVAAGLFSRNIPSNLDLALKKPTSAGLYIAAISPEQEPVTVGRMHAWTVTLTDAKGKSVNSATIGINGGMPQHGHGLPTEPAVTKSLGGGRFLVEGVKFNMPGWWEIDLAIDGPAGADSITFNLVL